MKAGDLTVSPTEGERADFPRLGNRYIIRSDQTDGRFALIEHTIPPRRLAAPVHTHQHEDEYSFVLTGRMGAMVGDVAVEAGPGELVAKPRGIPHAFWNAAEEEVHLLELISPGRYRPVLRPRRPDPGRRGRAGLRGPRGRPGALRADHGPHEHRPAQRALRPDLVKAPTWRMDATR